MNAAPKLPWKVLTMVLLVTSGACFMTFYSLANLQFGGVVQFLGAVGFGLLGVIAHARPHWTLHKQSVYKLSGAVYMALAIAMPSTWVAPLVILTWLPSLITTRNRKQTWLVEVTFNVSTDIWATWAATMVHQWVSMRIPSWTWSLLFGGLAFMLVETVLVSLIVILYTGAPVRQVEILKPTYVAAEFAAITVGGLFGALYLLDPWSPLVVFLPLWYVNRVMERINDQQSAYRDPMTGLFNHKYIDERLPKELEQAKLSGSRLSLVFSDMDYLRDINNTYGHLAGDAAIYRCAQVMQSACVKEGRFAARFGGEEFVLVLPGVGHQEAFQLADQIRRRIAESPIETDGHSFSVTMSFGIATSPDDVACVRDLVHAADLAVYQAKSSGRNRVCIYSSLDSATAASGQLHSIL